jgi:polysaccharide biosynthesis transport protein
LTSPISDPSSQLDLRSWLGILRRHAVLIAIVGLLALAAGGVMTYRQTPMFQSSSLISVNSVLGNAGVSGQIDETSLGAELDVLNSQTTRDQVVAEIGQPVSASFAKAGGSANIRITGRSDDPERASLIANTYAEVYAQSRLEADLERNQSAITVIKELLADVDEAIQANVPGIPEDTDDIASQDPDPSASATVADLITQRRTYTQQLQYLEDQTRFIEQGRVKILDEARPPSSPYAPDLSRNLMIALLVGLIAGVALAFAREQFRDTVDSAEGLETATGGLSLLGVIPKDQEWKTTGETHIVSFEAPTSPLAEAYRTLRSSLQFARLDDPIEILQVTSSSPFEGKSTTVANLGVTLSKAGQRVLIVDLDLRRPRLNKFFELDNSIGFTSLLQDPSLDRRAIAVSADAPNLGILTSGPRPKDPSELLSSDAARATIERLAASWDLVLIDSPPVLGVSDPLVISGFADATLLIVRSNATRISEVKSAVELLRKVQAPLVGSVVNSVDVSRRGYGYGSYGYGYGYGYGYKYSYGETPATTSATD